MAVKQQIQVAERENFNVLKRNVCLQTSAKKEVNMNMQDKNKKSKQLIMVQNLDISTSVGQ